MRKLYTFSIALYFATQLLAQNTPTTDPQTAIADTTIYDVADFMPIPMFNSCQPNLHPTWTADSLRKCSENRLLQIMAENVRYPADALTNNLEGIVVTSVVVETDGTMSNFKNLKDIGGGCGDEAMRVLKALNLSGLKWLPGQREKLTVRTRMNIPIRFRLQAALPYFVSEQSDTIYTQYDAAAQFCGGQLALENHITAKLEYPKEYLDSCKTGVIEVSLLVYPDSFIAVDNMLDFSNLGPEFQFKTIRVAKNTANMWTPAIWQDFHVTTAYPFRVLFKSPSEKCKLANENFDKGVMLADAAIKLVDEEKSEEAVAKFTEAIALNPKNTEWLYYRGNTYFALGKKEEGCADYNAIKNILGVTWFEGVRRFVCGY